MKELYTSAEFAKLCQVEKRTLFYYDEINLLKPFKLQSNGYRVYHYTQFDDMSMIKAMQSIGMSLKEIKVLSTCENCNNYQQIIDNHINHLKQKQRELEKATAMLTSTKHYVNEYLLQGCNTLFKTTQEEQLLVSNVMDSSFINFITSRNSQAVVVFENDQRLITSHLVEEEEESNLTMEAGNYMVLFIKRNQESISTMIEQYKNKLKDFDIEVKYPYYICTPTSHLQPCQELANVFRISAKIFE